MDLISIVMPVYNGMRYLDTTLQSVLAQTYINWELICINDSSTDNSLEILQKYAEKESRIKIFTTPNGGSASKATKFGISKISNDSKYYIYLSQDDIYSSELLNKCIDRAIQTNAKAVMPDTIWYYEDPKAIIPSTQKDLIGYRGDRDAVIDGRTAFSASITYDIPGFYMVATDIVRQVGFYDFSYNSIDATGKLWLLNCDTIAFCDAKFYYRQDNLGAITKTISPILFDVFATNQWLYEYINTHFNGDEILLQSVVHLQLDDFISRIKWLQDKHIMPTDKYVIAIRKTKDAYLHFRQQGGFRPDKCAIRSWIKAFLINTSWTTFRFYVRLVAL